MKSYDVAIIGGGPAGLAASLAAYQEGANVIIIEREAQLGGILKQCIHDGFGVIRFKEKLSGPEYAEWDIDLLGKTEVTIRTQTFVTNINKGMQGYELELSSDQGMERIEVRTIVLATGCRERTPKQIAIHGSRPVGVYMAGTAQYFVNRLGYVPCTKCVILGSGDIGLIMARRLVLEGVEVVGVYEAKKEPSGLSRNIWQCLNDFHIPLYLSHTVSRVFGEKRVTGVEIVEVNEKMEKIEGTEEVIACDGLILSVGLLPENELAEQLGIEIDRHTKGPVVNQYLMTSEDGIYSCGNALHVNDLVDYVSEAGRIAGRSAAIRAQKQPQPRKERQKIAYDFPIAYVVPQEIERTETGEDIVFYFRVAETMTKQVLIVQDGDKEVLRKSYSSLRPPEMERFVLRGDCLASEGTGKIVLKMVGECHE